MALMRILIYGDDRLQTQSEPLDERPADLSQIIHDMAETMYAANGVGLAATQVGISKRFFVLDVDQTRDDDHKKKTRRLRVFINPEILWFSDADAPYTEGCLSVPGVEAEVYRSARLRVRYRDENWQEHDEEVDGMLARVIQHEVDHLDGILFVDRLGFLKRQTLAGQLRRLRSNREAIADSPEVAAKGSSRL